MAKGLEDTRVIVTGAAGGIGRATAEVFLATGSRVVLADIDESRLEAPEEELRALGTVLASACDVTRLADVKRLVEFTAKEFGGVDVLVNCAGIGNGRKLVDLPEEELDRVLAVNLKGVILCCQAVLPHMHANRFGAIVNVASQAGKRGWPTISAYTASKAGVIGFTRSLAMEAAPDVRVNAVCPGIVQTEMLESYYQLQVSTRGITREEAIAEAKFEQSIPLGRIQEPKDIAAGIVFLASGEASEITGQALNICGGMAMD